MAKQLRQLSDFTQFGFIFLKPGSLKIKGANFTAVADITSGAITESFSSVDRSGVPHSFQYDFQDANGVGLHFATRFKVVDTQQGLFDCTIAQSDGDVLSRIIRIRTVDGLKPATPADFGTIFNPHDFAQQIGTTITESKGLKYFPLLSGKLQPLMARPMSHATKL